MNRKKALGTLLLSGFALKGLSKSNEKTSFSTEFEAAWKNSREYTLKIFNQMPEDKLDFKYTPESFSWRTQFVHCINFSAAQLCGRLSLENPFEKREKGYWKELTKIQLETELNAFYDWINKIIYELPDEILNKKEAYSGDEIPVWRLFYALENHIIHHRGQAICYLRLNGITPIGYIGW